MIGKIILYVILGIIALLVILLLIAVIRTAFNGKKPKENLNLEKYKKDPNTALYADKLAQMVHHETISWASHQDDAKFLAFHELLKKLYPTVFSQLEMHVMEEKSFLLKWKGKDPNKLPILIMAHGDVVPVEGQAWTKEPFGYTIEDGSVWGRGSFDNKSTLCCELEAIEELLQEGFVPETDVYLASSSNEESSGNSCQEVIDYLKSQGVNKLSLVIDEGGAIIEGNILPSLEGAICVLGVTEKGYANMKCTAKGNGGHSSAPKKNSPLVRLGKFMAYMDSHAVFKRKMTPVVQEMFETCGPYCNFGFRLLFTNMWLFKGLLTKALPAISSQGAAMLGTTCCFTMAEGSNAANVIPTEATVIANLRLHEIEGYEASLKKMQKIGQKFGVEVSCEYYREQTEMTNLDGQEYKFVVDTVKKVYPDVEVSPYFMVGGTDSRHMQELCDSVVRLSPVRVNNSELNKMHSIDESLRCTDLPECVLFYKTILKEHK